ncbi:MAG: hypothetical protein R2851_11980 [Caldilineaceae bacterium]
MLPPHDRLIVFASGKDRTRVETDDETGVTNSLHTNFRLDAAGGYLALFPPTARRYLDGTSVDYPPQQPRAALGAPRRDFVRYDTATPGASNDAAGTPVTLAAVTFSHACGLYDVPLR